MTVDMFVKSFSRDANWLPYLFRSIAKFTTGFRHTILLFPVNERHTLEPFGLTKEKVFYTHDYGDGRVFQQYIKLKADEFTGADFICHVDSDCQFVAPCRPEDYFVDGKPIMLYTPYASLPPNVRWKQGTEMALKREVPFEFMRRLPILYPKFVYREFRDFIVSTHKESFDKFVMRQPYHGIEGGISEFNWLGAYCWFFHHDKFHWVNTDTDKEPFNPLKQHWSYSRVSDEERRQFEEMLK